MSDTALEVEGMGKRYRIGRKLAYRTLRESLTDAAKLPLRALRTALRRPGAAPQRDSIFWALRDVSFDLQQGEVLGVIGRNGAGKSTLLKLLSRITEPTEGSARVYGRVGSLLEVGTGFHKELSGRDNIYLNASILGMKRSEVRRKFDEIVDFSGVGTFLDTPVKHYSSGIYMRLAFSVAAHLDPEILIVDEVLAVGDASFQKKCLGKMGQVAKDGRTVLFVSHNMTAVQGLCKSVLWLDAGRVVQRGPTADVLREYLTSAAATDTVPLAERKDRDGDGSVRIRSIDVGPREPGGVVHAGGQLRVTISYASKDGRPIHRPRFYVEIHDATGVGIYLLDSQVVGGFPEILPASGSVTCVTDTLRITPGRCYVNVGISKGGAFADWVDYAATFDVEADDFSGTGRLPERSWVLCAIPQTWAPDANEAGGTGSPAVPAA